MGVPTDDVGGDCNIEGGSRGVSASSSGVKHNAGVCKGPEVGVLVAVGNLVGAGQEVTDRGSKDMGESPDVTDMVSKSGSR